jgi:hypothetical protein
VRETETAPNENVVMDGIRSDTANNAINAQSVETAEAFLDRVHAFVMQLPGEAQLISKTNGILNGEGCLFYFKFYFFFSATSFLFLSFFVSHFSLDFWFLTPRHKRLRIE